MGNFSLIEFYNENYEVFKSVFIALFMMLVIVLPNFCFKITDKEMKEKK
jgi:hypothetical protein